jgi:opacity protein-like surface antigen
MRRSSVGRMALAAGIALMVTGGAAWAQSSVGVGPRVAYVSGVPVDGKTDAERLRYLGGLVRFRPAGKTAIEISLDYRSQTNDQKTLRVRDYPIQGSALFYLSRSALAPYILAGVGWYTQRVDQFGGPATPATVTHKFGYHAGLGGEIALTRRAAVFVDYRYTFLHFNDPNYKSSETPIPGYGYIEERLKLSHEGSMWTGGVIVYF